MKKAPTVLANGRSQSTLRGVLTQLLPALILGGLFSSVGIMHVSSRVFVVRTGYELSRLEQEARSLNREHDRLKLELATLRSPARLEKLAREKLSMGPPAPGTVFPVSASGRRKEPLPPAQAGAVLRKPKDKTL